MITSTERVVEDKLSWWQLTTVRANLGEERDSHMDKEHWYDPVRDNMGIWHLPTKPENDITKRVLETNIL